MMRETDAFLHALRFMTILPVRSSDTLEVDWLARAAKFFPAIGIVVGSLLVIGIGTHEAVLWGVLPIAVFLR